ncbi:MAG: hypothetical protein M1833_007256 [Piccolia ochrophora]|nr:MAG: hypothetical protein M1833_007256 [Piccolia ochrophora]
MPVHQRDKQANVIDKVQDLEKQLAHARQQLSHLRPLVKDGSPQDMDGEPAQQPTVRLPEVGSHPRRRQRPPVTKDLTRVRANLRNYGRGIFKPPPPYRQAGSPPLFSPPLPDLPVKATADHILGQYRSSVHVVIPILHWPTFHQTYESVYHHGTLRNVPPIWSSLLFAVLACGVLNIDNRSIDQAREGKAYIETSLRLTDLWNDEFTVDHARSALLTSIFLAEMNLRSAAWTWLGSSIRISQDIGLHCETGPWPVTEGEMRRRVWWGIYAWDRLLSTELGRPLQIDDNDCDVGLPCPVDDQYVRDEGILVPTDSPAAENFLVTTIHIVRFISPLAKALKSPVIANPTLNTFDTHFSACMAAFPPQCQIHSAQPLDPQSLAPICYLQNARLILHRHNLSTSCSQEVRSAAIDHCVAAARDTVHLLSRSMRDPAQGSDRSTKAPDWSARLASVASAMLCTHLWRCTLFLCFRGYYSEALTCVQACAAIGELRVVNQACGRNLAFFLHTLVEKLQRGEGHNLEQDEEMMVYVSGDVQGSTENSWVWQGSATGMELNHLERGVYPGSEVEMARALDQHSHAPRLSTTELQEWGGWPQIEWLLRALLREQEDSSPSQAQLSAPPGALAQPQPSAQSSSRISIANII